MPRALLSNINPLIRQKHDQQKKSHIKFLQKKNCKARKQVLLWKIKLRAVILTRKRLQIKGELKKVH